MYFAADFPDKHAAARGIEELKARGIAAASLDVFSTEPVLFEPGVLDRPSRMSLVAALGALSFCIAATSFIYYTQTSYPLVTGGMPIFSLWATGVPSYELTMFGAIVTTFACFLWESGLLRRGDKAPAPHLEPGAIIVRVQCRADQASAVEHALSVAGLSVRRLEERS